MQQAVPKLWIFFFVVILILVVAILATDPDLQTSTQTQTNAPDPTRTATFDCETKRENNNVRSDIIVPSEAKQTRVHTPWLATGENASEASTSSAACRAVHTLDWMLELGGNAIYVDNQPTGSSSILVGFAVLSQPGFIVVYDDNGGVPGAVIGESSLLESGGEHLIVSLNELLVEDQVYYAMLYHDDGDGRFRAEADPQAVDSEQSVILMNFIATAQAQPEPGSVVP